MRSPDAPALQVAGLTIAARTPAGEAALVRGVSFTLAAGQAFGLVGESGCGKTVTALALLGLLRAPQVRITGGSVKLRGDELVGRSERELQRVRGARIAMVFQEPGAALNPVMTIGAQVAEPLRIHRSLSRAAAHQEAVRLLGEVGLPDPERRAHDFPHQLSGGMKQRALIAAAIACQPAVVVADEPTTALDVTVQAQILALLSGLRAAHGMALLFITHDLALVAETCDQVAIMYAGALCETGPTRRVFAAPSHPYTRALLGAVPSLDPGARRLRVLLEGDPPSPLTPPAGCRFHPRCPTFARIQDDRCRMIDPQLNGAPASTDEHRVACHHAGEA